MNHVLFKLKAFFDRRHLIIPKLKYYLKNFFKMDSEQMKHAESELNSIFGIKEEQSK